MDKVDRCLVEDGMEGSNESYDQLESAHRQLVRQRNLYIVLSVDVAVTQTESTSQSCINVSSSFFSS